MTLSKDRPGVLTLAPTRLDMRELRQGLTALMAIFAIILHSLLIALTPQIAVASADQFDPYSIICLSGSHDASTRTDPGAPATQHNCGQCVICTAPALAGVDTASVVWHPTPVGRIDTPPSAPDRIIVRHGPKLPRGPPLTA
jgi:hypothetical protein